MAANTKPIWSKAGHIGWGTVSAANTAMDGTGTVTTLFTADSVNGSYVKKIRILAMGTNVATAMRFFINNGGANSTATNNTLYHDQSLAATTASNSTALTITELLVEEALPAGYKINVTLGTAVSAGYTVTVIGGDY